MKYYNLDVTIVATKYDKLNQKEKANADKVIPESFNLGENDNIVYFSSVTKKGKEEVYGILKQYL